MPLPISPTNQSPRAYDLRNLQSAQLMARYTQRQFGQKLYPQSAEEAAASFDPTAKEYYYDDPRRIGVVGDGVADDAAAFANMALVMAHGQKFKGKRGATYRLASAITPGAVFDLDLNGATVKPDGNHVGFNVVWNPDVTVSITSTIALGGLTFVVSSVTGITVGMWCRIEYNDSPTNEASAYPPSYCRVTAINAGTKTITVDRSFKVAYASGAATYNANFAADANMNTHFRLTNGTVDGSASTYVGATLGYAARILGFKYVEFSNLIFDGWSNTSTNGDIVQVFLCHVVKLVHNYVKNSATGSQFLATTDCMRVSINDNNIDAAGFGIAIVRADAALSSRNNLDGRYAKDTADAVTPNRSIRGIKHYGCHNARIGWNAVSDYESCIKVEACHHFNVSNNECYNSGAGAAYNGQVALNVSNQTDGNITTQGIVAFNLVKNSTGTAIAVSSSTTLGRHTIQGNQVKTCGANAISATCANSIITGNQLADWGLKDAGADNFPAINHTKGATITDNRFYHSSLALPCMSGTFTATFVYAIKNNVVDPLGAAIFLLSTSKKFEDSGTAIIASGTTSIVVNHSLFRTPQISEIHLKAGNNPTNDPGVTWVSAVAATTFTISCRNNPGANYSISWDAAIAQPFTA